MVLIERKLWLCLCVLLVAQGSGFAQEEAPKSAPAAAQPAPQKPAETPAPPPVPSLTAKPAGIPSAPPAPALAAGAPKGEQRDSGDGVTSFTLSYWLNGGSPPKIRNGHAADPAGNPANLDFPSKTRDVPGATLSFPAGNQNTLQISYFRTRGQGNTTAPGDITFFGAGYTKGDYLSAGYTLQNGKVSLDYFTWPFPAGNGRFRLKTLWEVQFTSVRWAVDAPLKPTEDADGNVLATSAARTNWFLLPTLGLGVEYMLSKHFRWEAKGSGFTIPHHTALGDVETFGAYRSGQVEFQFGAKGFYFKSSPKQEQYVKGLLAGAFVGVRWYPK